MKKLVKLLILVLVVTMTTESYAQKFGIKAGLNLSNMLIKDDGTTYSDDFKLKPGFHVGVVADFEFTDMFSFETGLLVSTKGYKYKKDVLGVTYEAKANLLYLDIPLTAKASFDLGEAKVFGLFGPYVGVGLSGKEIAKAGDEKTENKIEWGSEKGKSDLKRFDFGLAMGAGVGFNAIQVGFTYNLGLANISPITDGGAKIKNKVMAISLAYMF